MVLFDTNRPFDVVFTWRKAIVFCYIVRYFDLLCYLLICLTVFLVSIKLFNYFCATLFVCIKLLFFAISLNILIFYAIY